MFKTPISTKFCEFSAVNCGPLSLLHSSGIPWVANNFFKQEIVVNADSSFKTPTSKNPEYASTVMRCFIPANSHKSLETEDHGLDEISLGISVSFDNLLRRSWHIPHLETFSSICLFIPGQNNTSLAKRLHNTIPKWLSWTFCIMNFCIDFGITTRSPRKTISS